MNARCCSMVCLMLVLGACGDDDGPQVDAGIDSGARDAMPDSPTEAGTDACDGPYQHRLYVAPFEGTCLGPGHEVPGSCVTGLEGMTGNGELWCFTSPEGVLHAGFIQYGEDSYGDNAVDPGEFAGADWVACEQALSQLVWPVNDYEADGGLVCVTNQQCVPYCGSQ